MIAWRGSEIMGRVAVRINGEIALGFTSCNLAVLTVTLVKIIPNFTAAHEYTNNPVLLYVANAFFIMISF